MGLGSSFARRATTASGSQWRRAEPGRIDDSYAGRSPLLVHFGGVHCAVDRLTHIPEFRRSPTTQPGDEPIRVRTNPARRRPHSGAHQLAAALQRTPRRTTVRRHIADSRTPHLGTRRPTAARQRSSRHTQRAPTGHHAEPATHRTPARADPLTHRSLRRTQRTLTGPRVRAHVPPSRKPAPRREATASSTPEQPGQGGVRTRTPPSRSLPVTPPADPRS